MSQLRPPIRIANCSGFYGDRLDAPKLLLEGPEPFDVLTGDYLAELTMLILHKAKAKDPTLGYASTFLAQMEMTLETIAARGIKVVVNAGGLNPRGLASAVSDLASSFGLHVRIATVEGDDLSQSLDTLIEAGETFTNIDTGRAFSEVGAQALTANAYLGGWGIAEALRADADIVITGRVTDAALVLGPAAWWHGWAKTDWDALAGAVVAGHVIECGTQATGGNYPFIEELPDFSYPGFPICEVAADGSSVITKQRGTGGLVSVGTVTCQLLYEIQDHLYLNPDVVTRFDTVNVSQVGPDRVSISGVRGLPAPERTKVAINYEGGFRNEMTIVLTGGDIEAKATRIETMLFELLGGKAQFDSVSVALVRSDQPDAQTNALATARLKIVVKSTDKAVVGRRFSRAVTELVLASVAGFFTETPPGDAKSYGVYWPALIDTSRLTHQVRLWNGSVITIEAPPSAPLPTAAPVVSPVEASGGGETTMVPLGRLCGARSGDKGGNANVGLWVNSEERFSWLVATLDEKRLKTLFPEFSSLVVRRTVLENLLAINFVIVGILGEGVASTERLDPQAKGLGEFVRSRLIEVPTSLL